MSSPAAVTLLLLALAAAAQAHWPDVKFRDLAAEPESGLAYRFSVLAVNTEGTTNANNVSFELEGESGKREFCRHFLSLPAFEKRTVECRAEIPAPGRYTLVFQSERLGFTAGEGPPAPSAPAEPQPASPPPPTPGFGAPGALAALAAAAFAVASLRRPP
ncbi:MAG: hypothetical protein QXQ87_05935 [Halobacteria archaeon]